MKPLELGQRVHVDTFGLGGPVAGLARAGVLAGIVVGVAPGALVVRLDGAASEVTVGRHRVEHAR